ncbi:MAG: asparagine synthase-related protein [Ignavibacteria bacterium]
MQSSIEMRSPFIDYRHGDVISLPDKLKMDNGVTKKILENIQRQTAVICHRQSS